MRPITTALMATAALLTAGLAQAAAIYSYSGTNYTEFNPVAGNIYSASMSVTGNFEVAAPLLNASSQNISAQLLSFSFSDGLTTLSNTTSGIVIDSFVVSTNAAGNITAWNIQLSTPPLNTVGGLDYLIHICSACAAGDPRDLARTREWIETSPPRDVDSAIAKAAGTWELRRTVPEPGSLALLALGLFAFALAGRIRQGRAPARTA